MNKPCNRFTRVFRKMNKISKTPKNILKTFTIQCAPIFTDVITQSHDFSIKLETQDLIVHEVAILSAQIIIIFWNLDFKNMYKNKSNVVIQDSKKCNESDKHPL